MPRIISMKLLKVIGFAFVLNDYQQSAHTCYGFTEEHAIRRAVRKASN